MLVYRMGWGVSKRDGLLVYEMGRCGVSIHDGELKNRTGY